MADKGKGLQKEFIYVFVALIAGGMGVWQVNNYVNARISEYRQRVEQ